MKRSLYDDGVLIDLSIGFWSALARNQADDLRIKEDVPDFVVGLGMKQLVDRKTRRAWAQIAGHARYVLRKHSFAFPIAEVRFVPLGVLGVVEAGLRAVQKDFFAARDHLLAHYDKIRQDMLRRSERHQAALAQSYPPVGTLKNLFYFTWQPFTLSLPRNFKKAALDARQRKALDDAETRYKRELETRVQHFINEAVTTLRAKTVEMCRVVAEKARNGDVVTNRSLNSLREHIDRFKELNFFDDPCERQLDALKRELLNGRDAETFDDDALRAELTSSLDGVIRAAGSVQDTSAVSGAYRRRILL